MTSENCYTENFIKMNLPGSKLTNQESGRVKAQNGTTIFLCAMS